MACSQSNMEELENFTKPEEYRLYVANLPVELKEVGIKQIFDHYGKIIGLFYRPNATWTFVTYRTYREAEYALRDLHNKPPLYLKVSFAKEKPNDEIKEEKLHEKKSTELYEHLIQDSVHNNKEHIQTINRGKRINAFYKEKLGSPSRTQQYVSDDFLYPLPTDPYTYDPYESAEPYNHRNALWTRGTVTVTHDGKRHVSHGRGYTSYEIPDPHPKIETLVNRVHERRFNGLYEHGQDFLKHRIGKCIHCDKPANMTCERCYSFYCSRKCQVTDWPYHKTECRKIPALIKNTGSLSTSSNEDNTPVSNLPQTQKTLRRPRHAALAALRKNGEVTTNRNTNIANTESYKEENFQNDHQTDNTIKTNSDVSKLTTIEKDDTNKRGSINSSDALQIEKNLAFRKNKFLSKDYYIHLKIVGVEENGVYWVQMCRDKRNITEMAFSLMDMVREKSKVKPVVGNMYTYKLEESCYRVRVTSLNPTKIFLVDYGTSMTITDDDFREINMEHVPPYASKICLSESAQELLGTLQSNEIIVAKAVDYRKDMIIVDVKHKQTGSIKSLNKSVSESSTRPTSPKLSLSTKKETKFLSLSSVLDYLRKGESGYLDVQTMIYKNVYGVIIIPNSTHNQLARIVHILNEHCEDAKQIDEDKISIGQLVCGKTADTDWFRGCVVSIKPIRLAMLDETRLIKPEKVSAYPDQLLNVCKFGVICEISTDSAKLKAGDPYNFKVISHTNEIKIEIIVDDGNNVKKIEAVLKPWEPKPEQSGVKLCELKNGSEVCITAYHSPNKLYVRSLQTEDVEKFHKIMQDVAKCAQSAPNLEEPPVIGEMVLAKYTDDNFYRAIVTKVDQDEVRISYVDYGNGETISLKKLKVLPTDLKLHPSCAAKVLLKDVPNDIAITKDVSEYFIHLTGREIPLIYHCDGIPSEDGVSLTMANGESVNDKVKKLLTPSWKRDNEKDETVYTLRDIPAITLGDADEVRVVILRAIHEGYTYVVCPLDWDLITNVYDVLPGLMNEYCEKADYYIPRTHEPCLALYDGNWYRALCMDSTSNTDKCQIFFLDYGNVEVVLHKDIRAMTKDFLTPSTLSNICSVVNLAPLDEEGNISPCVLKRISELINPNDNVLIKIVEREREGFYKVEFPEIHATLIKEGLI